MRSAVLIFSIGILVLTTRNGPVESVDPERNVIFPEEEPKENDSTCTTREVRRYSDDYHNCVVDKKYEDGGKNLESLVDRILEQSTVCVRNSSRKCRPNLKGLVTVMDKVIYQMKHYCQIYVEHLTKEKDKIKDLQCVEKALSAETYQGCFKEVFVEGNDSSEIKFQQKVENAISCTNKSHKLCSKAAKTSLNRMVRTILRVEQPEKEDIEDDVKPDPPKRWYHYIIQPFISIWRGIRSFFGF